MSEYRESENSCVRCLLNSPIASLLGFILVLIGSGAFGGATIFLGRNRRSPLLDEPKLCPYLDPIVYGLIGAIGLFSVLAYVLCALSSGSNAKRYFHSRRASFCGRCCNMLLIVVLVLVTLLWIGIVCFASYPLISTVLLLNRPENINNFPLQPPPLNVDELKDKIPAPLIRNERSMQQNSEQVIPTETQTLTNDLGKLTEQLEGYQKAMSKQLSALNQSGLNSATNQLNTVIDAANNLQNQMVENLKPIIIHTNSFDLSYYGLYDKKGDQIFIKREDFKADSGNILCCLSIAVAGALLLILGFLQIIICSAMNYARLQDSRCYESADADEEGEALHK